MSPEQDYWLTKLSPRPFLFYLLQRRIRPQPWSSKARPPRLRRGSQLSGSAEALLPPLLLFLPWQRAALVEMRQEARIVHATRLTHSLLIGMRKICFGRRSRTPRPHRAMRPRTFVGSPTLHIRNLWKLAGP